MRFFAPFLTHLYSYWHALKRLNRDVRLYLLTAMLAGFVSSGVFAVLLNLYLTRLGYDPTFIGLVNAARQAAFIVMSVPAGLMGRRWGTRRMILAGILCYLIGHLLIPLAEFAPTNWQKTWFIGASLFSSFGGPFYWVNGNLFMMDKSSEVERNHAFSLRTAFFPMAGFVGSLVGGVLPGKLAGILQSSIDHPAPYRYTLLSAAFLFVPAFLLMLRAGDTEHIPKQSPQQKSNNSPLPYALFIPMILVIILRTVGETSATAFYNIYFDSALGIPPDKIGFIAAIALFVSVPSALITPTFSTRWGNDRVLFVGMIGMVICMLPFALIPHPVVAAISYISFVLFTSATKPTLYVYRLEIVSAVWWATMSGVGGTAHGIGQFVASGGGGYLITEFGYRPFFLLSAFLTSIGAGYFWLFSKGIRVPKLAKA